MTTSSCKIRSMYLKVHTRHLILATRLLYKLVDVTLRHVMRALQYVLVVIIIVEEFWVLLRNEVQEVLAIHFTGIDIYVVELFGLYDFYSLNIPTLYHNCLIFLVLINHFSDNFSLLIVSILNLFLFLYLWHLNNDNCLLVRVLLMLNFNLLHCLLTFCWRLDIGTIGWWLSWLHDLLDCILVINTLWQVDEHYFANNLVKLDIW